MKHEEQTYNLQSQIYGLGLAKGKEFEIKKLQRKLLKSLSAKLIVVRKVTLIQDSGDYEEF